MSRDATPRVVIADDHPVFRDGLATALTERSVEVSAVVASGEGALEAVAKFKPDAVLMDLGMPGMGGVEATRRIVREDPSVGVLVLTMSDDDASLFAALRAGARGYLLKESTADEIVHAVRAVAAGQAVIGTSMAERVFDTIGMSQSGAGRAFPQLTQREFDVLDLMARGLSNGDIALRLGLAEKTVRNNVSTVLTKVTAASRAEAIAKARDAGVGEG